MFNQLQEQGVKCGIDPLKFWDYTLGEIRILIEAYIEKVKEDTKQKFAYSYNNAVLIAIFVCKGLNGDRLPPIEEVYPDMFKSEQDIQIDVDKQDKVLQLYKEQFIDFANAHNEKLKKMGVNNQ